MYLNTFAETRLRWDLPLFGRHPISQHKFNFQNKVQNPHFAKNPLKSFWAKFSFYHHGKKICWTFSPKEADQYRYESSQCGLSMLIITWMVKQWQHNVAKIYELSHGVRTQCTQRMPPNLVETKRQILQESCKMSSKILQDNAVFWQVSCKMKLQLARFLQDKHSSCKILARCAISRLLCSSYSKKYS